MPKTNERAFEESIEKSLISNGGYIKRSAEVYNKELAIDTSTLFTFLKSTQKSEWDKLADVHGKDVEAKFINRLTQELENRGMLDCLWNGITDNSKKFKLANFKSI
jgi:type I restriction enzyme R subunit